MTASELTFSTWHTADIADAIETGLAAQVDLDRIAQSVHGIDVLDEVDLHPVLAGALSRAGFGTHREVRYPAARRTRARSEGRRCDLVLTPEGRSLQEPEAAATLFDDPSAVPLSEALWLEVKVVAQFREAGPTRNWSGELLGTVQKDIAKLAADQHILHAGLLIILWVDRPEVAEHDFGIWQDRCLERGLPIGAPAERIVDLQDRIGHSTGVIRLYPVHHL